MTPLRPNNCGNPIHPRSENMTFPGNPLRESRQSPSQWLLRLDRTCTSSRPLVWARCSTTLDQSRVERVCRNSAPRTKPRSASWSGSSLRRPGRDRRSPSSTRWRRSNSRADSGNWNRRPIDTRRKRTRSRASLLSLSGYSSTWSNSKNRPRAIRRSRRGSYRDSRKRWLHARSKTRKGRALLIKNKHL